MSTDHSEQTLFYQSINAIYKLFSVYILYFQIKSQTIINGTLSLYYKSVYPFSEIWFIILGSPG